MQYLGQSPSALGTIRRKVLYIVKRGKNAPSTRGMLQHTKTKYPQVYETVMKSSSHSTTKKEDWALALASGDSETP